jgi:hypothetical protein
MHSEGTLNLHHKAVGLQYPFCRETSCNRVVERFLVVERSLEGPKRTSLSCTVGIHSITGEP